MENEIKNTVFDLKYFKKIEDIIFLDEPILTHYVRNEKNFFLYLVDSLENSDILLLFELELSNIVKYITGKLTLKSIIENNPNFIYLIEQDFSGKIIDVKITQSDFIDENYLPSEDSFLIYNPSESSYYYEIIREYERKAYLQFLREKAFYIKFAPSNKKYADTIGLNQLVNTLLSNLSLSFKNFLKVDFLKEFKYDITDLTKLNSIFNKLLPDLDFRMVDLKYGSFEIGLSIDSVMKSSIENPKMKDWAIKVGDKYKEDVLDVNYNDESIIRIINNYDEADRKQIFTPLFNIIENTEINFEIKRNLNSNYKKIRIIDKTAIEKILPKKIEISQAIDDKDYQIMNVTTVIDRNKKCKSIDLDSTLFSSTDQTEVFITNKEFSDYGFNISNQISLAVQIKTDKSLIILSTIFEGNNFEANVTSGRIADGVKDLTHKIYEYILNKE